MNKIVLLGKLIKDPELKTVENGEKVFVRFILAVDRNFKSADGTRKADLIPVTMWGRKAEVICKYMTKGSYISLSGRLRTSSYEDKDGNKKYRAEVVAEDFKFVGNKKSEKDAYEASGDEQ
jgi:single-strand DNA-binding protein